MRKRPYLLTYKNPDQTIQSQVYVEATHPAAAIRAVVRAMVPLDRFHVEVNVKLLRSEYSLTHWNTVSKDYHVDFFRDVGSVYKVS